MFGHVEVDNFTTIMSEHEKDIQDLKCRRRHGEEVDRYQVLNMIIQKGPLRLRWRLRMMDHVFCDCRLGDVDAEQLKFAVNSRCTPANIVPRHRPDKFADLRCDGWAPTHAATGLPGPVQSKALAVPAHQGIRFEDLQCLQATWPQAVEPDPEQPLAPVKLESFAWYLVYHGQLLAKRQDFEAQEGAALE